MNAPDAANGEFALALESFGTWLQSEPLPLVVIDGVAVAILAESRNTKDIDLLAWAPESSEWPGIFESARSHGFDGRIADALSFADRSQMLLLKHRTTGVDIDLVFGALPFEKRLVAERVWVSVGGFKLPFPKLEYLCVMKAIAGRPRDLADLETLFAVHPGLDIKRITREVRLLADAIDDPAPIQNLQRIRQDLKRRLGRQSLNMVLSKKPRKKLKP
ncbi:MAG: hypothetical protein M5U26_02860 [Planctomycetota bacterium]|nr:hypothetical protein [Planctomycetota bacterium]